MRISDWSSDVCSSDLPAIGTEPFEGAEPRLLGHARRSFDPITEIDIGKAGAGGALDMIENDIGAQPFAERVLRVEEAVDHRQSVALPVRSEEHTSELQSLMRISYAVFCLTKKNKKHRYNID